MSDRADKLLRELLAATDELEGTPIEWRIAVRIGEAQKLARAYLNEKPQPIKDADMVESGHASERLSPPSAAAEPEKPMSDDLLEAARAAVKNARPGEFVLTAREIGQLLARLDASPSAQPIAREEQDAKRYRKLCDLAWGKPIQDGIYDLQFPSFNYGDPDKHPKAAADRALDALLAHAALKSAGKEST